MNDTDVKKPYLTKTVVFGMHAYRRKGEDSSVCFVNETRGVRKKIVDSVGIIHRFPGIVKEDFWLRYVSRNALLPQIRFRTSFEKSKKGWIVLWQIQPDGMYWADDEGFGAGHDVEVDLYTYLDEEGNFTAPFRIYSLDGKGYALARYRNVQDKFFDQALAELTSQGKGFRWIRDMFPQLNRPGLGNYDQYYALRDLKEARAYWEDPELSDRLRKLTDAFLQRGKSLHQIVGEVPNFYDEENVLRASLTLFWLISGDNRFKRLLD